MATPGAMAARRAVAQASIEQSMAVIGAKQGVDVPPKVTAGLARDPAGRDAQATARVAEFLAAVAEKMDPKGVRAAEEARQQQAAPAATPAGEPPADPDDEPAFHGRGLRSFDGMTDDEITALDQFGPATLADVRKAQRKHNRPIPAKGK